MRWGMWVQAGFGRQYKRLTTEWIRNYVPKLLAIEVVRVEYGVDTGNTIQIQYRGIVAVLTTHAVKRIQVACLQCCRSVTFPVTS